MTYDAKYIYDVIGRKGSHGYSTNILTARCFARWSTDDSILPLTVGYASDEE